MGKLPWMQRCSRKCTCYFIPHHAAWLAHLRAMARDEAFRETLISVDTFYAAVAAEAVAAGAHVVNDVSGGNLDPAMLKEVAPACWMSQAS
jgi:dihydropteroate synthase